MNALPLGGYSKVQNFLYLPNQKRRISLKRYAFLVAYFATGAGTTTADVVATGLTGTLATGPVITGAADVVLAPTPLPCPLPEAVVLALATPLP
jgi:hypothetical protein